MVKQLISVGLLVGTLVTAQMPSARLDVEGWRALHPEDTICGITLWPDRAEVLVNNVLVKLDHAPFVENDLLYVPLEDLAALLGDTVQVAGNTIILQTEDGPYILYAGETRVTAPDGKDYVIDHELRQFSIKRGSCPVTAATTPLLRDGTAYAPTDYVLRQQASPEYLSGYAFYPEDGFAVLDLPNLKEQMCDGFAAMTNFDELPAEQRAKVHEVGSLGITRDYYDEVEYRGDGYAIHVARLRPGEEDGWGLDGIIVAIVRWAPVCHGSGSAGRRYASAGLGTVRLYEPLRLRSGARPYHPYRVQQLLYAAQHSKFLDIRVIWYPVFMEKTGNPY